MSEEVALVDTEGRVVGSAARAVVRRDNLLHAATAVLVRDSAGRIHVHRRSRSKDWAPDHHDAAAGGMLRVGEDPVLAAVREVEEELGFTPTALRPLGLSRHEDGSTRVVEHCYETTWDGPVRFVDGEVVWGAWMTMGELAAHLADPGWLFVPDTRALFSRLGQDGIGDYVLLT
jgi:isopentenyldiphosphate isomerase